MKLVILLSLILASFWSGGVAAQVTFDRLKNARQEPHNWLTYSGDYAGQRYSPLAQINQANVQHLGVQWIFQTGTAGPFECTPLVVDGIMYVSGLNNRVYALDALSGRLIWRYERALPEKISLCCGRVNRGLATLGKKVFLATLDAYVVALDAKTGSVIWEVKSADYRKAETFTLAPLAVKDKIIVGIAGGDLGNRGFIEAYEAESGKRAWRFYTVPAPGEPGNETWQADSWKTGGGPAWVTGTYDSQLNLIYWGTGNPGSALYGKDRRGDNLYTDCVVALDADSGKLKWYFQFTPHDVHDWDSTQVPVLLDLDFEGAPRKLLVEANRNGFFYVLDRTDGRFLLGQKFGVVTWAKGIDVGGRPILLPDTDPTPEGNYVCPGAWGVTNWMSPSYSPQTGLFYVAAREQCDVFTSAPPHYEEGASFFGSTANPPPKQKEKDWGAFRAIDPMTGQIRWEFKLYSAPFGGMLSTAGGLVFGGDMEGYLIALDAQTGKNLWHFQTGSSIYAAPVSYALEGKQHVSIASGGALLTLALPDGQLSSSTEASKSKGDWIPLIERSSSVDSYHGAQTPWATNLLKKETDTTVASQGLQFEEFLRACEKRLLWLVCLLALFPQISNGVTPVWVDFTGYDATCGIQVSQEGSLLQIVWPGEHGQTLRVRFNLGDQNLLIRDISISRASKFVPILENACPQYMSYTGKRRGGWDNFFDHPPGRRSEITTIDSSLKANVCRVTSEHQRVRVSINGFEAGIFRGQLIFTFYKGGNLLQQEAVVRTEEPDVAYYYDAWLNHCSTRNIKSLAWLNTEGEQVRHVLISGLDYMPQIRKVRRRVIVAEGPNGSLGLFPPPHQFFFARDETINFGYVWHRSYSILDHEELFAFGIRQDPEGGPDDSAPLFNAPPGTEQRWNLLYYIAGGGAEEALSGVSAFTHNDSFKTLPGYQTFSSHYHMRVAVSALAHKQKPYVPEFKEVFKQMGVKMVQIMDYHGDGHPYTSATTRLEELQAEYDECRRLSDAEFLLIPGEEGNFYLGGHWGLLFPRPVYWFWVREEGQSFQDRVTPYGDIYRLGSAADTYKLVLKEKGLVWQTHPRAKGSVNYPDRLVNQDYFKDPRWLGAAFKNMPNDLSTPRLGERGLNVLDDMNNWGGRRFLIGELDVFQIDHTHELYGHMNINYLRMAKVASFPDWGTVLETLSRGDFFVTTGEVLIRDFLVGGKRSGESLVFAPGTAVDISADLEWTFPLNIVELVWGDGKQVNRMVLPAGDTPQFGQRQFKFTRDLTGIKWIRFAAWDVAANGAFTQPVYIEGAKN